MGDMRNSLRHLGMLATSQSWRRHWWPQWQQQAMPSRPARAPAAGGLLATLLLSLADWWQGMALATLAFWRLVTPA